MLERLTIENYALIEHLELEFSRGLTIITGETGAGKSIMLDAIGLLMGERADSKAIADKSKKTIVETIFSEIPEEIQPIFEKNSIDWDRENLIIRREITPAGRSRAFVNDTPVTLQILSEITNKLVDIHSQHNNISLQSSESHLKMIDDFKGNKELLKDYKKFFSKYVSLRKQIKQIKENLQKTKDREEYIRFRLEQLEKIKPKEGELEKIEKEFDILNDADQIRNDLSEACGLLNDSENSILSSLSTVESLTSDIDLSILDQEEDIQERLSAVRIELKDIYESLTFFLERIEFNPSRLSKLSDRINLIYDAIKRFKVKDEKELVELYEELEEDYANLNSGDQNLKDLEKEAKILANEIKSLADKLTCERKEAAAIFSSNLQETATPLGLPNLRIEIDFNETKLTSDGQDKVTLICSFNKNQPLQSISSVASGGELSRLMLSLKSILADKQNIPTVIFDEIDTGVSGEIADKMGEMMKEMASKMQVIVITHLPQVAAKGECHFKVFKNDNEEKTVSNIKKLNKEERIQEIASMLSGSVVNKEALANAKALLGIK